VLQFLSLLERHILTVGPENASGRPHTLESQLREAIPETSHVDYTNGRRRKTFTVTAGSGPQLGYADSSLRQC